MADSIPRFGASDFFLTETDAGALREALRSALETVLGREVVDADPHMVLAGAFLPFLVQGQASADACAKATLRAYAQGADLDRIADSTCAVGYLDRYPAMPSVLPYCLQAVALRSDSTAPGTCRVTWSASRNAELSTGEGVEFEGSGAFDVSFPLGSVAVPIAVPVYLVCSKSGADTNGIFADTDALVADADVTVELTGTDSTGASVVYNFSDVAMKRAGSAYNGADAESDEDFAQRVAWQAKALRVSGSYEYFALALQEARLLASWFLMPSVDSDGRIVVAVADKVAARAGAEDVSLTSRGDAYSQLVDILRDSMLVEQRAYIYFAHAETSSTLEISYRLPASTQDVESAKRNVESAYARWLARTGWHCGAFISEAEISAILIDAGASVAWVSAQAGHSQIRSSGLRLPADSYWPAGLIALAYDGLSADSASPTGTGGGEEVLP